MKRFLLVLFLFLTNEAIAKCDFKTGDYINELSNPKYLSLIEINIPKSSNFTRNAFKIITLKSDSIPKELKKKFKASILIHYKFGKCKYAAKVRQSGDWKDHIKFNNAQVVRSLDIKLADGNIMNAVKFKLLIPETRNGINEILASLILRKLNFISPETFEINTSVNGVKSIMLFQEKEAKENLERNARREGPIFEGDESLIWLSQKYRYFELEPLSLSRLVNDKWFMKGINSQSITLNAYEKLQRAYINYAYSNFEKSTNYTIFPNFLENENFINYHTALLAMNASHALRPHNRKYYYNAIESKFEPIYYDGNVNFGPIAKFLNETKNLLPYSPTEEFVQLLFSLKENKELFYEFSNRVISDVDKEKKFLSSMMQYEKNLIMLNNKFFLKTSKNNYQNNKTETFIDWYQNFQKEKKFSQTLIKDIFSKENSYNARLYSGITKEITTMELAGILSRNNLENKRTVYIPSLKQKKTYDEEIRSIKFEDKLIKLSNTMHIELNKKKKILILKQTTPNDWALLLRGDYSDWQITFNGLTPLSKNNKILSQRFNNYGLTGCLNIYDSLINNTYFSIFNGTCEDSVNIIGSKGKNISFKINNAFADALDLDFSELSIKYLNIIYSGNDCLDVSGGNYFISHALLTGCKDKALSVGEKSILQADNISATSSNIGVSAKDLSIVNIANLKGIDVSYCAEVKQKKQEFGGAKLFLKKNNCSSAIEVGSNSVYITN